MPMYDLMEYSDNYSKTSGSLWQYCKDIPAIDNNNAIVDFTDNNLADSFNLKVKVTGQTGNDGTENVEIMAPIKYLSNFWRTLEMPLINSEVNLILAWSGNGVIVSTNIVSTNQNARCAITDTKSYVPVVTLSTLGLTAAASATDAAINKKVLGSGNHTTLIISNDDMQNHLKIVKSLEDSGSLLDGTTETVKNEVKEQKGGFLSMFLGTLGASLLGNMLAGRGVTRAGEGTIRAGYGSKKIDSPPIDKL